MKILEDLSLMNVPQMTCELYYDNTRLWNPHYFQPQNEACTRTASLLLHSIMDIASLNKNLLVQNNHFFIGVFPILWILKDTITPFPTLISDMHVG